MGSTLSFLGGGDKVVGGHPVEEKIGPDAEDGVIGSQAEAVGTGGEDVQFRGDAGVLAGLEEEEGVFDGDGFIGFGVGEENGGCFLGDTLFGGEGGPLGLVLADEGIARAFVNGGIVGERDDGVEQGGEVGAGAEAVDGIGGVDVWSIGLGGEDGGEVSSGRKSEHAEAMGVDVILGSLGADEAHRALGIFERNRCVVARGVAIAEDKGGDVVGVEHQGDVFAFLLGGEVDVAAAGENEDGRAGGGGLDEISVEGGDGGIGIGVGAVDDVGGFVPEERARRSGLGGRRVRSDAQGTEAQHQDGAGNPQSAHHLHSPCAAGGIPLSGRSTKGVGLSGPDAVGTYIVSYPLSVNRARTRRGTWT